jgi:hypothetical protein
VYKLEDGLYALLYHPESDKVRVSEIQQKYCVLPECVAEKNHNIESEIELLKAVEMSQPSLNMSPASPHPSQDVAEQLAQEAADEEKRLRREAAEKKYEYFVHSFDGERNHLASAAGKISMFIAKKLGKKCINNKLPAGGSVLRSLNDNSAMHPHLHSYYGAKKFTFHKHHPTPQGGRWKGFRALLKELCQPADFRTAWEAFKHAPSVLSKACTQEIIMSACINTGVLSLDGIEACEEETSRDPSDLAKIISAHPHFQTLDQPIAEALLKVCHPQFVEITRRRGFVMEGLYFSKFAVFHTVLIKMLISIALLLPQTSSKRSWREMPLGPITACQRRASLSTTAP